MKVFGYIVVIKRSGGDYTSFPLTTTTCSIGRNQDCDIRVQLPTVSKQHCHIKVDSSGIAYVNNASLSNPTLLNNNSLGSQERNILHHQDIISIADRQFRWEYPEGSNVQEKLKNLSTPKKLASVPTPKKRNTPYKESAKRSNIEKLLLEEKGKRVSFGPYLSPEQYDKKMPPSTPIRKGQTPLENDLESSLKNAIKLPPLSLQNSFIHENVAISNGLLKRRSPTPVKPHLDKSLGIFNTVKSFSLKESPAKTPSKSSNNKQNPKSPKSQKRSSTINSLSNSSDKGKKRKLSISPSPVRKKRKVISESKTPKSQKLPKSAKKSSKKVKTFAEALKAGMMKKTLSKAKTPKGKVAVLKLQTKRSKVVKKKLLANEFANNQQIPKTFNFGIKSTGHIDSPANIIIHKKLYKTPKVYKKGKKLATQPQQVLMSPDLTGIDLLHQSETSTQTSSKFSLTPTTSPATPQAAVLQKSNSKTSSQVSNETTNVARLNTPYKRNSRSSKTPLMHKSKSVMKLSQAKKFRSLSKSPIKTSVSQKHKSRSLSLNAANKSKVSPKTLISPKSNLNSSTHCSGLKATSKIKPGSGTPLKQNSVTKASVRSKSLPKSPKSFSATPKTSLKEKSKTPTKSLSSSKPKITSKAISRSFSTSPLKDSYTKVPYVRNISLPKHSESKPILIAEPITQPIKDSLFSLSDSPQNVKSHSTPTATLFRKSKSLSIKYVLKSPPSAIKHKLKSPHNCKSKSLSKTLLDHKSTLASNKLYLTDSSNAEIHHLKSKFHARSKSLTKLTAATNIASKMQPRPRSISKINTTPKSVIKTMHKSRTILRTPDETHSFVNTSNNSKSKSILKTPKGSKSKSVLKTPKSSKSKSILEISDCSISTSVLKTQLSSELMPVLKTPKNLKLKSIVKTPNSTKTSNRSRSTSKKPTSSNSFSKRSASRSLSNLSLPDESKPDLPTPNVMKMVMARSNSLRSVCLSPGKRNFSPETSTKLNITDKTNSNTQVNSKPVIITPIRPISATRNSIFSSKAQSISTPVANTNVESANMHKYRFSTPKMIKKTSSVTPINYTGLSSTVKSPSRKCSRISFKDNSSPHSSMSYASDQQFSMSPSTPTPLTPLSGRKSRASVRMSPSCSPVTPPPNLSLLKSSNKKKLLSCSMNMSAGANRTTFDFSAIKTPNITADNFVSPLGTPMSFRGVPDSLARLTQQSSEEYLDIPIDSDLTSYEFESQVTPIISTDQFVSPLASNHHRDAVINSMRKRYVGKSPLKDCSITNSIQKLFENKDSDLTGAYNLLEPESLQVEKILKTSVERELTPIIDHSNISGVRRLLRTTPKAILSPVADYTDVRGLKRLLNHKSPRSDYSNILGLKKLLLTPKNKEKELCQPNSDYDLVGLRKLLKSPQSKLSYIPDYTDTVGIRSLYKSTRISCQGLGLVNLEGIKDLLTVPATPVNSPVGSNSTSKGSIDQYNLSSSKNDIAISLKSLTDAKAITCHSSPKVLSSSDGGQTKQSSCTNVLDAIVTMPLSTGIKRKLLPESPITATKNKKSVQQSIVSNPILNDSSHSTEITIISSPAANCVSSPLKITRSSRKKLSSPASKPVTPSFASHIVESNVTPRQITRGSRKKVSSPVINPVTPSFASHIVESNVTPKQITRGSRNKVSSPAINPVPPSFASHIVESNFTPKQITSGSRKKVSSPAINPVTPSIASLTVEIIVTPRKMTRGYKKKLASPVIKSPILSNTSSTNSPKKITRGSRRKNLSPGYKPATLSISSPIDGGLSTPKKSTSGSRKKLSSPAPKLATPSVESTAIESTISPRKITRGGKKKYSSPAHKHVSPSMELLSPKNKITPKKVTRGGRKKVSSPVIKAVTPSTVSPVQGKEITMKATRGRKKKLLPSVEEAITASTVSPVQKTETSKKSTYGGRKVKPIPPMQKTVAISTVSPVQNIKTPKKATRGRKAKPISPVQKTGAMSTVSPVQKAETPKKATRGRKAKPISPVQDIVATSTQTPVLKIESPKKATRGRKTKPKSPVHETFSTSIVAPVQITETSQKATRGRKAKPISPVQETVARSTVAPVQITEMPMKATRGRKAKPISPVQETVATRTPTPVSTNMETKKKATRCRKNQQQSPVKEYIATSVESPKATKGKKRKSSSKDDLSPPKAKRVLRSRKM